jgi:hypothetical protein
MAQKRLTVFAYWVNHRFRLQESIDAAEFTPLALEAFSKLMTSEAQDRDASTVKASSEFKAGCKWKSFKEGVVAYFNSIMTKD